MAMLSVFHPSHAAVAALTKFGLRVHRPRRQTAAQNIKYGFFAERAGAASGFKVPHRSGDWVDVPTHSRNLNSAVVGCLAPGLRFIR